LVIIPADTFLSKNYNYIINLENNSMAFRSPVSATLSANRNWATGFCGKQDMTPDSTIEFALPTGSVMRYKKPEFHYGIDLNRMKEQTMKQSRDSVIFALDVPSAEQAKQLAFHLKESVGLFKIGLELFIRSGPGLIQQIREKTGAGIFLDLKLHDIPATVERAMRVIATLEVDLTTVHCSENRTMMEAAVAGSQGNVGVLGVTLLTSVAGSDLTASGYKEEISNDISGFVVNRALAARDAGCAGVVCSGLEVRQIKAHCGDGFLAVTPGVRFAGQGQCTDDQRRVVTPAMAVSEGADYIVVGRPIRDAADPVAAAGQIAAEIDEVLDK
jgi:orotidine-5'-phosphate decarboxylase